MEDIQNQILLISVWLLFSGLFSGLEIAFISRDKLNFEIKSNSKSFFGKVFGKINKNTSAIIATLLIGNNLSLVIYGLVMAQFLEPLLINNLPQVISNDFSVLLIQILVSTLVVLITAEYIPKSIFLINPDKLFFSFSIPLLIIYYVFYPVVKTAV